MSRFQKIRSVIFALGMIAAAVLFMADPDWGYYGVLSIFGIWLLIYGINTLVYYFTMARHMVGGRVILYKGIIITDFGYLTASINDIPKVYILLYLLGIHAFNGLVEVLRALEQRRYGAGWKVKLTHGIVDILIAVSCVVFVKKAGTVAIIYGIGLIYSAIMRIVSAIRKPDKENAAFFA